MRRAVTATVGAAALLVSAACQSTSTTTSSSSTSGGPPASASESSSSVSSAAPSATTSMPLDPAAEADSQAMAVVTSYYQVLDSLYADASVPLEALDAVTINQNRAIVVDSITVSRSAGESSTGSTVLSNQQVTSRDLSASPPSVMVSVCVDISGLDWRDASGAPLATTGAEQYIWISEMTVVQTVPTDPTSWRVSLRFDNPVPSCD